MTQTAGGYEFMPQTVGVYGFMTQTVGGMDLCPKP